MTRQVYFSFEYEQDITRANVVRNSWVTQGKKAAGFFDKAELEEVKKYSEASIKKWIDDELKGTSVTVVLVGQKTCSSKWVRYEIDQSKKLGKGLLGIDISEIADFSGRKTKMCGQIPVGYHFYSWVRDEGYNNMGKWIEKAARSVSR